MKPAIIKVLCFLLYVFLLLEAAIRITSLDAYALYPKLFFMISGYEIHHVSDNAALHYELLPNRSTTLLGRTERWNTNALALRGTKEYSPEKPAGVTRILCVGGSNTFGYAVEDDGTWPYQLEQRLNRQFKGKFEVLNAGAVAYMLRQNVERARLGLAAWKPDIIIFQHGNIGRRAFLWPPAGSFFHRKDTYQKFFDEDPDLYFENLPCIPFARHQRLSRMLLHCAVWRAFVIYLNYLPVPRNNSAFNSDLYSDRAFADFVAENGAKTHIFFMELWRMADSPTLAEAEKRVTSFRLLEEPDFPKGLPEIYYDQHPPRQAYGLYAKVLSRRLAQALPSLFIPR